MRLGNLLGNNRGLCQKKNDDHFELSTESPDLVPH
jgi:hypothetical protein